jgi:hypothetical protein
LLLQRSAAADFIIARNIRPVVFQTLPRRLFSNTQEQTQMAVLAFIKRRLWESNRLSQAHMFQ